MCDTLSGVYLSFSLPDLQRIYERVAIADLRIGPLQAGSGRNGKFLAATRTAIIGNNVVNDGGVEHNLRSMNFTRLVVAHNRIARPEAVKANITLRAPG